MTVIKTAISLQESLFQALDKLAAELNTSRSGVLAIALEEYIVRHENMRLLEALDAAYTDDNQNEELELAAAHLDLQKVAGDAEWS